LTNLDGSNGQETLIFTSFINFVQQHNKQYDHQTFEERYYVFRENYKRIELLNAKSPNKVFGINKFADMTPEEFRKSYLMPKGVIKNQGKRDVIEPKVKLNDLPDKFDWRDKGCVTKVKNQGQCGSCWAFSVTENVESVWIISSNQTNVMLSPQQVVDCDSQDGVVTEVILQLHTNTSSKPVV
jgi:C1A family cysteine protease